MEGVCQGSIMFFLLVCFRWFRSGKKYYRLGGASERWCRLSHFSLLERLDQDVSQCQGILYSIRYVPCVNVFIRQVLSKIKFPHIPLVTEVTLVRCIPMPRYHLLVINDMSSLVSMSCLSCIHTGLSKFSSCIKVHSSIWTTVQMYHPQHKQPPIEWNQVLLNDRDPVRWYESVKNTILNVVTLFSNPIVAYNPLLQLLLVLTGRTAMQVVPKVLT